MNTSTSPRARLTDDQFMELVGEEMIFYSDEANIVSKEEMLRICRAVESALLAHMDATPAVQPIERAEPVALTTVDAIARIHASSYASPHHIIFTVQGLRSALADLQTAQPAMDAAPVHSEAVSGARPQITDERLDAIFAAHHNPEEPAWVNYRRYGRAVRAEAQKPQANPATDSVVCGAKTALPTLRVGKTYVARDGAWVTITSRLDGMYPYVGDNGRTYLEHGFEFDGRPGYNESPNDLIALASDSLSGAQPPNENESASPSALELLERAGDAMEIKQRVTLWENDTDASAFRSTLAAIRAHLGEKT